jgi:hypothetical protein
MPGRDLARVYDAWHIFLGAVLRHMRVNARLLPIGQDLRAALALVGSVGDRASNPATPATVDSVDITTRART